jgi:hypothetical protein
MKLIAEVFNPECETLVESADGKKSYFIEGKFMVGNQPNKNKRIYPTSILEKEMLRFDESMIKTSRALGELGHPNGPQINADRVSHRITEMFRDKDDFMGKAKIMATPFGEIVKTFIDEGVKIGVSTRGLGTLRKGKNGIMEVSDDFILNTVDIVTDPSGPGCFVNGIMENTEYFYDVASGNYRAQEVVEEAVKKFKKKKKAQISEAEMIEVFTKFMKTL